MSESLIIHVLFKFARPRKQKGIYFHRVLYNTWQYRSNYTIWVFQYHLYPWCQYKKWEYLHHQIHLLEMVVYLSKLSSTGDVSGCPFKVVKRTNNFAVYVLDLTIQDHWNQNGEVLKNIIIMANLMYSGCLLCTRLEMANMTAQMYCHGRSNVQYWIAFGPNETFRTFRK